ncbi:uncharacterized protein TNCV_5043871 [Trichonephila clavipes]|uniref:Uncharacterized protein n=1 Tax=Trichonephila clavipes TaxID=2585209 RepID=A0A8X7BK89_TRICX|nr:uncharacterized protein TNCV_5043871 [Trichonephila clavipes]
MHELGAALRDTDLRKSLGLGGIHSSMIDHLGRDGLRRFLDIFNISWKSGCLPRDWKRATVVPIRKPQKDACFPESLKEVLSIPGLNSIWVLSDSRSAIQHLSNCHKVGDNTRVTILEKLRRLSSYRILCALCNLGYMACINVVAQLLPHYSTWKMDWASSEWKQGLTPLAVQKVNALEEKIDKLQKERQQKQLQCECLELSLDKEKRKVEKEKQQTTLIERELQSLGDICKDFENKQQKLQNEIQNRDSRIGCLEGLLAQTKKDNCRLQQLENDLEELRSIRETSRIEKEQKELSFTSDQKLITLQDSVRGSSEIDILHERENNQNVLNDNDLLHSYKEKITTLELTIQELRSKLDLLSSNESNEETTNSQSKTPGKPKIEAVEASPSIRARSTSNVWDSFASTPAKEKETFIRHHSNSSALDSTDGKVLTLQTQLKQLRQELDCQRHNFEASKNSLEQKFKEKENRLKDDLKYQLQVSADLDKELKDTKNKYQQEITQASKKLDVLAAQLKKAEVTNETFKKDMKQMETKINSNNLSLKAKEEEVQDLLKQKNAIETSLQSLQTQVFEVEKKCKVLEKQNSSLTDNINTVKLQLDGSCNLVQEKENCLAKANKELEIMSISNKKLQVKVQELENILLTEQKRNAKFIQDEKILMEKIELLESEQNQLNDKFSSEIKKSQEFECTIEKQQLYVSSLKNELTEKTENLDVVNKQMMDSKNEFEEKIIDLNNTLKYTQEKCAAFESSLEQCSLRESTIKEKLGLVEREKEELLSKFNLEVCKTQELETSMVEAKQAISLLREELLNKSCICEELDNQLKASKDSYEIKINQLEEKLSVALTDYTMLENQLKESSLAEISLKQKLEQMNKEKEEIISQLNAENNLRSSLDSKIVELDACNTSLKAELSNKSLECDALKKKNGELESESMNKETKVRELEKELSTLQNQLQLILENELHLKEQVQLLENEKKELGVQLIEKTNKVQNLSTCHEELKSEISSLQEELLNKSLELQNINQVMETSTDELKVKVNELDKRLSATLEDYTTLENQLKECAVNEMSLKRELEEVSGEKEELASQLAAENNLRQNLEIQLSDLRSNYECLKEELCSKSSEYDELNKKFKNLETEYKAQTEDLEDKLTAALAEIAASQKRLQSVSSHETELRDQLDLLHKEKEKLNYNLTEETEKVHDALKSNEELKTNISSLQEELSCKISELERISQIMETSSDQFKIEVQFLEEKLSNENNQSSSLKQQLEVSVTNERRLLEEINSLEEEKIMLEEKLIVSNDKIQELESSSVELKQNIQVLNEKLCKESSELEKVHDQMLSKKEHEKKIQDLQSSFDLNQIKHAELENQLQEFVQKEALFTENILKLQSEVEGFSHGSKAVDEEMQKLTSVIDEQQVIVQDLERKLNDTLAENQLQLQKWKDDEALLLNKIDLLIVEKEDIAACLETEISKRQNLELNIEGWKTLVMSLEEDLYCMSLECEKIDNEYQLLENNYESKKLAQKQNHGSHKADAGVYKVSVHRGLLTIEHLFIYCGKWRLFAMTKEPQQSISPAARTVTIQMNKKRDLESKLFASQTEQICQFEEWNAKEVSLKNKLQLLEKERNEISLCFTAEIQKNKELEVEVKQLIEGNKIFEKELNCKVLQLDEVMKEKMNIQTKIQELENELLASNEKYSSLTGKLQESSAKQSFLKEEVDVLTNVKQELELKIEELNAHVSSLGEFLSLKTFEQNDLIHQNMILKKDFEIEVQDLEQKLSFTDKQLSDLSAQLEEMKSKEKNSEETLQLLEKENLKLNENSNAASEQIQKLELDVKESKRLNNSLEAELSVKSVKMDELTIQIETLKNEYLTKIRELENELLASNKEYSLLTGKLQESSAKQSFLKEEVDVLTKVKQEHEFKIQELNTHLSSLGESLSLKTFEQDELIHQNMVLKEDFEIEVQNLEQKLSFTDKQLSDLSAQLEEMKSKEKDSDEILQLLEKENLKLNENSNAASEQIQKLELDVKESKRLNNSLEAELSVKSVKMDELTKQIETLKNEYLWTVQKLQGQITAAKTENEFLHIKVKNYLLSEELWQKKLETIEKEKHNSNRQMLFLSNKISVLELGVKELKKIILTLQVLLISNSGDTGVNNEMIASKECNKIQSDDEIKYFSATKVCATSASDLKSFSCSEDKDFFRLLLDFSAETLNKICDLEYDLIDKLEKCKKAAYLLYLAKFNKIQVTSKPTYILGEKLNVGLPQGELNSVKFVDLLSIHETPFFLNFAITLRDWISKMCCNASNAVDDTPTAEFCYSTFQLKHFLPSLASSSPMFHVFWKYYEEVLHVNADILDEVCYWKYHYNVLGINKNDILKIITQLEKRSKNEEKLNRDTQLKINSFSEESRTLQSVKESLEHSLKVEKEKQKLLNATIEEIEKDLGETFLQKEKFKNMALNTNKLLLCLKKQNGKSFVFSNIKLVGEIYSDTCFCEKCILEEEIANDSSHDILTLKYCFEWINRLIHAGCQLEKELNEFRQQESDLRILYEKSQDRNSQLEMTVDGYSKDLKNVNSEIENVRYELMKQIEKNEILSKSIDKKDALELELFDNIEENKNKMNELEHKVVLLSTDKEKIEFDLLCKEKEIISLKSLIDEKTHLYEKIRLKCDEYENKISLLNSTISRFEEEKKLDEHLSILNQSHNLGSSIESDCFDGKSSKTIINELQNQINSLKKSNDSLNLNMENMEGELKNVHLEKQNAVEKLQKLSEEISTFTQKYNDEKKTTRDLLLKLNDFENRKNDTEGIISQLKCKNESLEKDINVLKFVNREHEQEIFKKNSDLEKCHHLIEQLQNKIEEEQSNFKIQIKNSEKSEKLKIQLKEMIAIKSNLEEEITKLKLVETEKTEILKKLTDMEFQKNCITQQFDKLKSEMEETDKKNQKLKVECKELNNLLNDMKILKATLEEDLNKKENCIACLNCQLEGSSTEHAKIIKINSELSAEVSSLKKAENCFQLEIESLTKQLKDSVKNIKTESHEKQPLKEELEDMKERLIKSHKLLNVNLEPEFQKTKNGLNNALNFISNILKIISTVLENYYEYSNSEVLKFDIRSLMIHWKKNPEEQYQVHIFDHLRLFFKTLIDKHIEDSAISKHVTSIMESVNNIGTLCESNQNTNSPIENVSNLSLFEKTFTKNSLERNDYSPTNVITNLLCIKKEIDSYFYSLKSIISERTEEINILKGKLQEFSSKANECNCKSSDMDKTSFKWKYELFKRQNRQLEEKYNKAAALTEEMEKSIKILQEEKLSLEEEADELCNELKKLEAKYASSEELINTLEELNKLKQKLRDTENENNWLKRNFKEIQLCQVKDSKQITTNSQKQTELSMFERPYLKENYVKR